MFPPAEPVFFGPTFGGLPPILVPPVIIPPGEPPCDPKKDPDCPEDPEEPPIDVPEPGVLLLLITGLLTYGLFRRRRV